MSGKQRKKSPGQVLKERLLELLEANNIDVPTPDDIPKKWDKHGDLVLLPSSSLHDRVWQNLGPQVWDIVAESLNCKRVGRKHSVKNNDFRSPCTELLKGSHGWVTRVDNGIKCTFDVTTCMFSAGNITEKLRIAKFDCRGETVVDLFAGIGYFTLPFLIHAKATLVHACEWNPHAIEALEKNTILNDVQDKCVIHFGDNRQVCPKRIADRVNLGLIPSSECGWHTACEALKPSGGILHIHGIVTSGLHTLCQDTENKIIKSNLNESVKKEWTKWGEDTCVSIGNILFKLHQKKWVVIMLHTEHLKSYAPHIAHIVADIQCKPS